MTRIIKVTGKVQGVFFRASAKDVADRLELRGFVRNQPDGSVYIEADGEEAKLNEFIRWCHDGPPHAQVTGVIVEDGGDLVGGYQDFQIQRIT